MSDAYGDRNEHVHVEAWDKDGPVDLTPMTDPQTPATEAGRLLAAMLGLMPGEEMHVTYRNEPRDLILAIEAEARALGFREGHVQAGNMYDRGRADALREAADAYRALKFPSPSAVLAILDPQP